jgi:hypothetical protein
MSASLANIKAALALFLSVRRQLSIPTAQARLQGLQADP